LDLNSLAQVIGKFKMALHSNFLKTDLGKLSPFLQKTAKKMTAHPSLLARRYASREIIL
jgi:hypothetical protein